MSNAYKIECGAFVTKFMHRCFIIHARDEEDARIKAKARFEYECKRQKNTEPGTINIDDVRVIGGNDGE